MGRNPGTLKKKNINREELLKLVENEFGPGCAAICRERVRQKEVKGYHIARDYETYYKNEQLAEASATYALAPNDAVEREVFWPWDLSMFNQSPNNRQREFEKSGALMAAQIDVTISKNKN